MSLEDSSWTLLEFLHLDDFFYDRDIPPQIFPAAFIILLLVSAYFITGPSQVQSNALKDAEANELIIVFENELGAPYTVEVYSDNGDLLDSGVGVSSVSFEGLDDSLVNIRITDLEGNLWESGLVNVDEGEIRYSKDNLKTPVKVRGDADGDGQIGTSDVQIMEDLLEEISVTGYLEDDVDLESVDITDDEQFTEEDPECIVYLLDGVFSYSGECPDCEVSATLEVCNDGVDNNCDGQTDIEIYDNQGDLPYNYDLCACNEATPCEMIYDMDGILGASEETEVKRCSSIDNLNNGTYNWYTAERSNCTENREGWTRTCGGKTFVCNNDTGLWKWDGFMKSEVAVGPKDFVRINNGDFYIGNEQWRPFGINYWPAGAETGGGPTSHWLHKSNYESQFANQINRELAQIRDIGFNSIMIQIKSDKLSCTAVNDAINKAGENDLKVLLFIPNCDPFKLYQEDASDDRYKKCTEVIESCELSDNENIFAYDLAWEPRMGEGNRYYLKRDWTDWILERYGSFDNMENSIGKKLEFDKYGLALGPSDGELCSGSSGSSKKFAVAYLRFFDDWVAKEYSKIRATIKEVDDNHLLTVRAGYGLLYATHCSDIPVEIRATANAVDFMGAEFYRNELEDVKQNAGFIARYSELLGKKPVVFIEYGYDAGSKSEQQQKQFYSNFYSAVQEAGAQGSFAWWYTGTRTKEGITNDFGIVESDSYEERDVVTEVIRNIAETMKSPLPTRTANRWITLNLEDDPRRAEMRLSKAETYGNNLDQGSITDVMTPCSKTTSETPYNPGLDNTIRCVADVKYNYKCPLKCLNGQFEYLQIKNVEGDWQEVKDGSIITVQENSPVLLKASLTNIAEGTWLDKTSVESIGAVRLGNAKTKINIMPVGDSRTNRPGLESYRYWLWEKLNEDGYKDIDFVGSNMDNTQLYNAHLLNYDKDHSGNPGWTASRVLNGWSNQPNQGNIREWVGDNEVDIFLINLGINDIRSYRGRIGEEQMTWQEAIAQSIDDYSELLDFLQTNNPKAVILVTYIYPAESSGGFPGINSNMVEIFNGKLGDIVNERTEESPIILVDQYTGFDLDEYSDDGIHQNEKGAKFLANKWYGKLAGALDTYGDRFNPQFSIYVSEPVEFLENWEISERQILSGFSGERVIDFSLNSKGLAWFGEKIEDVVIRTQV